MLSLLFVPSSNETKEGDPPTVDLPLIVVWRDGLDEAGVRV